MDARVEKNGQPDWRRHVANTSPHGEHDAEMVVGLQERAALALCKNDDRVDNLVELGQVKEPAPESKALVPESAHVLILRGAVWRNPDELVLGLPDVQSRVVSHGVTKSARSVQLAQRVCGAGKAIGGVDARPGVTECAEHCDKCYSRIDDEAEVVEQDKGLEELGMADAPWLEVATRVVGIEDDDGDQVAQCDCQWNLELQDVVVEFGGDRDWALEDKFVGC